jgi:hypothetical protein
MERKAKDLNCFKICNCRRVVEDYKCIYTTPGVKLLKKEVCFNGKPASGGSKETSVKAYWKIVINSN